MLLKVSVLKECVKRNCRSLILLDMSLIGFGLLERSLRSFVDMPKSSFAESSKVTTFSRWPVWS